MVEAPGNSKVGSLGNKADDFDWLGILPVKSIFSVMEGAFTEPTFPFEYHPNCLVLLKTSYNLLRQNTILFPNLK